MANEITQFAQYAPYGGSSLTITGSTIGNAAASILSIEGSGNTRGYKYWKSGQAEFLNTLKTLNPGTIYLVNAKTVPMDFPPPATSGGGSTPVSYPYLLHSDIGDPSTLLFAPLPCPQKYSFALSGSLPNGVTVQASLNGATPSTLDTLNSGITILTDFPYSVEFTLLGLDPTTSTDVIILITSL